MAFSFHHGISLARDPGRPFWTSHPLMKSLFLLTFTAVSIEVHTNLFQTPSCVVFPRTRDTLQAKAKAKDRPFRHFNIQVGYEGL